ncbi:MAG: SDR family NAD(P)-dependent oxidoreductase [Candidatus Saccharibacteria bacterium]|nr:SDR family NAD(P)-dependent oxidoreductase [Pseudorhodobacter sp.]
MELQRKVILITGATGGIGAANAQHLAAKGARVLLLDRGQEPTDAHSADLSSATACAAGDISTAAATEAAVAQGIGLFGPVNGAFLNAGTEGRVAPFGTKALEVFDQVMAVYVRSAFIGLSCLMPVLRPQVDEVAALVAFLLCDAAVFCNGATYQIDGARMAGPRARNF